MSDAAQSPQKFSRYCRNVVNKAWEIGGGWIRDNLVVPVVLVVASAFYAYFAYQLRPDWHTIVPLLWINGSIVLIFAFGSVVFGASQLDQERLSEIETLKAFRLSVEERVV